MSKIFALFTIWGLSSCATTNVHLFTEGLAVEQIENIEANLSKSNYETLRNTLPVPIGIKRPTIVYSPLHRDLKQVEKLRDILSELGYEVDLEPISKSNHYYTSINVGVYLTPYIENAPRKLSLLGKELFGECPDIDANLTLDTDLSFSLDFLEWDEIEDKGLVVSKTGSWRRDGSLVYLQIEADAIPLEIIHFRSKNDYAKIDGIKLKNIDNSTTLKLCNFSYTELDPW